MRVKVGGGSVLAGVCLAAAASLMVGCGSDAVSTVNGVEPGMATAATACPLVIIKPLGGSTCSPVNFNVQWNYFPGSVPYDKTYIRISWDNGVHWTLIGQPLTSKKTFTCNLPRTGTAVLSMADYEYNYTAYTYPFTVRK